MTTDAAFDDPDQALPTEDDDPESLAGEAVEFDPDDPDGEGEDPTAESSQPAGNPQ